jgi:hypothetical protein
MLAWIYIMISSNNATGPVSSHLTPKRICAECISAQILDVAKTILN